MNLRTLRLRQQCAEVLAGRVPWLHRKSFQLAREAGTHGRATPLANSNEDVPAVRGVKRPAHPVFWKPEYYSQFTVVVDATTFTNREEPPVQNRQMVYVNRHHTHGPRLVKKDTPISAEVKLMVYAAIHPHLGLVAGPDVMFTGSRLKQSTDKHLTRTQQFEKAGVETWYGIAKQTCL